MLLEAADRQCDRLGRLIDQLLVARRVESRPEGGGDALGPVSLPALCEQVVDELRARANGHTLDLHVDPGPDPVVTDEGKVRQILTNLLENAVKYSPDHTTISVRCRSDGDSVVLSVRDEGPGIPVELQGRIFERFFQGDRSARKRAGGAGLGLYICRKLAHDIGAAVALERSDERGSVFSLRVPRSPSRPGPELRTDGRDGAAAARVPASGRFVRS